MQRLDVERRTVLGTLYETLEEAEAEREKVVGDKKFNSKEEADKERERLRIEKEIEEQEMNIIWNWEAQKFSPIDILANLLSGRFTSKRAQNKIREYNNKVFNIYSSLKSKNVSLELAKLRTKQGVCMIGGIIAILIGIGPFFALGWIGKIIIFCIVAFPWGLMMQAREDAESYKKEEKILKYIERIFYINAGKLYLKEARKNNYQSTTQDQNNILITVRVIEKYKDTEKGQVLSPGVVFKVTPERAQTLVNAKVVEIV